MKKILFFVFQFFTIALFSQQKDFLLKNGKVVRMEKYDSSAVRTLINGKLTAVITNPSTDQILKYDGANWVNSTGGGGGSETLDQTLNLGNITDTNMVFKYLGSPPNANSMTPVIAFEIPAIDTFRSQVPFKFLRWSLEQTGGAHSDTVAHNEGIMFGFNFTPGGGQEDANKISLFESWESNYLPDWATRYVEKHEVYYAQNTGGGIGPGTGILGARLSSYTINAASNYIDFYHTVDTWRLVPKANPSLSYFAIQPGNLNLLNQYFNKNFRLEFTDSTLLTLNSGTVPISIASGGVDLSDGNLTNFRTPGFKSDGLAIVKNNGNIGSSPDHYFYVSQNGLILRNLTTEALGISFSTGTTTFNGYGTGSTLTFSSWAAMNFNSIPIENFAMPSQIKQTSIGIWRTDGNTGSSAEEYMNISQNGIVIRNLTNTNVVQFGVATADVFHIRGYDLAETFRLIDFNTFDFDGANVIIGSGGAPVASAQLEMNSTTKGFLPPRMTKTQRDAISSPAEGLVIYQTDNTPGLRCYNGTNWMRYTETAD